MRHFSLSITKAVELSSDFDPNDRAAIEAALNDPNPANPIAVAVAARITAMTEMLAEVTESRGGLPSEITINKPKTVLDEIAVDLWRRVLAENPDAPRVVILDHDCQ